MGSASKVLTVLVGAGMSQALGLPGTDDLTALLRKSSGPYGATGDGDMINVPQAMWRMAASYYSNPNFETMLHLAETALAYPAVETWLTSNDRFKPAYGAFMTLMPHWEAFIKSAVGYSLSGFYNAAVEAIAQALITATNDLKPEAFSLVRDALEKLQERFRLVIATLNYDDVIERALPDPCNDGFERNEDGVSEFVPRTLLDDERTQLLHLHGSVRFYVIGERSDETIYRGDDSTITFPATRKTNRHIAQSGDPFFAGPMISGLRKTDKVTVPPFGYYQYRLHDVLMRSPRCLLVGYGGADTYLNGLLIEMQRIHGSSMRLAFVGRHIPENTMGAGFYVPGLLLGYQNSSDFQDLRKRVDEAAGTKQLIGNDSCKVYVDGFPVAAGAMDQLVSFLES